MTLPAARVTFEGNGASSRVTLGSQNSADPAQTKVTLEVTSVRSMGQMINDSTLRGQLLTDIVRLP